MKYLKMKDGRLFYLSLLCIYSYQKNYIWATFRKCTQPNKLHLLTSTVTSWDFLQTGRCNREFRALKGLFCPHLSCTIQMLPNACHQIYLPLSGSNSFGHTLSTFSFSRSLRKYLSFIIFLLL